MNRVLLAAILLASSCARSGPDVAFNDNEIFLNSLSQTYVKYEESDFCVYRISWNYLEKDAFIKLVNQFFEVFDAAIIRADHTDHKFLDFVAENDCEPHILSESERQELFTELPKIMSESNLADFLDTAIVTLIGEVERSVPLQSINGKSKDVAVKTLSFGRYSEIECKLQIPVAEKKLQTLEIGPYVRSLRNAASAFGLPLYSIESDVESITLQFYDSCAHKIRMAEYLEELAGRTN